MTFRVTLLPGDGVGPEVTDGACRVLERIAVRNEIRVTFDTVLIGGAAIDAHGTPLRAEDLERCRASDALLLGAVGGPRWDDYPVGIRPESGLLRLRSELGLAINLRPIRWTGAGSTPLKEAVAQGADIAFVRELSGGIYFGKPSHVAGESPEREAIDTCSYTERQITRVLDFAFALARSRRGHVTSVDKANVLNTSRLWRDVARDYGARNPDVRLEHALVDSFAMAVVQNPRRFDVVVTENLFGDILTDLAGVIAGSLGLLPSASLRPELTDTRFGLYEPVHGSAPDIAGKGIANPTGAQLSVALALRWSLGRADLAADLEAAVDAVLRSGRRTADLASSDEQALSTDQFTDEVLHHLDQERRSHGRSHLRHHVA